MAWKLQHEAVEASSPLLKRRLKKRWQLTVRTPVESASDTLLSYVTDQQPGISRVGRGKGFRYYDAAGRLIRKAALLRRIKSLVIPAWKDVWICTNPNGHLQATGRDVRNRKQYLYHPRYRSLREESKYDELLAFGTAPLNRAVARSDGATDPVASPAGPTIFEAITEQLGLRLEMRKGPMDVIVVESANRIPIPN